MMIITISRQTATNGELIGRLVAEQLGIRYVEREIIENIARQLEIDPDIVMRFDEVALNQVHSVLWEWRSSINEQVYGRYLRDALKRIAAEGDAVIIGRGANYVLTGPEALHVRIVAPLALRSAIYRATHPVSEWEARRVIRQGDESRARFVRRLFHQDIDNSESYDLVLNLAGITPEDAASIIANAAMARMAQRLSGEPQATFPQHVEIMTRHRRPVRPDIVEPEKKIS